MADQDGSRSRRIDPARLRRLAVGGFSVVAVSLLLLAAVAWSTSVLRDAVRAYIEGESLWSKAQKEAVIALQEYARTGDEADWRRYREALRVPLGDRRARRALLADPARVERARAGFRQGGLESPEIGRMILAFRWLRDWDPMRRSIEIWTRADSLVEELRDQGARLRRQWRRPPPDATAVGAIQERIDGLNRELDRTERAFTGAISDAAERTRRWSLVAVGALTALLLACVGGLTRWLYLVIRRRERALRQSERRRSVMLEQLPAVVYTVDRDLRFTTSTGAGLAALGLEPDEVVGTTLEEFFGAGEEEMPIIRKHRRALEGASVSYRQEWGGRVYRGHLEPLREEDGEVVEVIGVAFDVTEREEARRALRASEERYRQLFRENMAGVIRSTLDGRVVEVNRAAARIFGYGAPERMAGLDAADLYAEEEGREPIVETIRETGEFTTSELAIRRADGSTGHVSVNAALVTSPAADRREIVATVVDITERKQFERELERQALHDQLTGLPNRALFRDRLAHALERADRAGDEVGVLFLDLDRFKAVNDSFGHPAGDRVLRTAAVRLQEALRDEDTVARVGGDEFAVLLEDLSSSADIERAVGRIRDVFEVPFEVEETSFSLTASIGAAHSDLGFEEPDELVRLADAAMYRVKQPGRTDVHVFDPDRDRDVTEKLQQEAALERALEEGEFVVHYQPIHYLASGRIGGAEALVRWEHPERGLLLPGDFIPRAESSGLIVPLGEQVLEEALRRYARWRDEGLVTDPEFRVSVNLSARQLESEDLAARIRRTADRTGAPLSGLMLEITETTAMTRPESFHELRGVGLGVAIDDFGTGYSSLEYLSHFDADVLKLDRSFVDRLTAPDRTASLVRGILDVASRMGLEVTAEGIETEEQLRLLRAFGCPYGQGFLYAGAVPAGEFAELYRHRGGPPPDG